MPDTVEQLLDGVELHEVAQFLCKHKQMMTKETYNLLSLTFNSYLCDAIEANPSPTMGELDLADEVSQQLAAVRKLRKRVMNDLELEILDVSDAKNALQLMNTLIPTLVKLRSDIYNQQRMQNVERSVHEVLQEMDLALQIKFKDILTEKLGLL